jgi:Poxvirus serine/threonine protein kinase
MADDEDDGILSDTSTAKIKLTEDGITVIKQYKFPLGDIWYYKLPVDDPKRPENVEIQLYKKFQELRTEEILICPKLFKSDNNQIEIEYADLGDLAEYLESYEFDESTETTLWAIILQVLLILTTIKKQFPTFIHGCLSADHVLLFERPTMMEIKTDYGNFDLSNFDTQVALCSFTTSQALPEIQNEKCAYIKESRCDHRDFLYSLLEFDTISKKLRAKIRKIHEIQNLDELIKHSIFDEFRN